MLKSNNKKRILYILTVLLITIGLSVGFSAFQKDLNIEDLLMHVRIQKETRITGITIENANGAISNSEDYSEDYNVKKVYGSVTFDNSSSYMLYKVSLTNYGNVKMGLLAINSNTSEINYQVCNSSGKSCTSDARTAICDGNNCTLGASKDIYVKVATTTAGTKNIDLDFNFQPYHNITYDYIQESTNSFPTEIMNTDSFTITLTSKPEEVEVSGTGEVSYNKNTGVLTVSNVGSDLSITAKYLVNDIAENGFSGTDPNNYVLYNNTLFRMIESNSIDDGYDNIEQRTNIVKHESIGDNMYDDESEIYSTSSLAELLNTTYYNSLSDTAKEMIDTVSWENTYTAYVGLIDSPAANDYHSWLTYEGFLLDSSIRSVDTKGAIVDGEVVMVPVTEILETRPCVYLKPNVLIVSGSGTQADPYILELSDDGLQPNPTKIRGRELSVTGSNQQLVTVENQVGTPRYSLDTPLNSSNYQTDGVTTIPVASGVGYYTIYYYIPAGENYKPKSGAVSTNIEGITFVINYAKGANINTIEIESDTCTTTGSNTSCTVTLPGITPNAGYTSVGWSTTNGDITGVTGSYTLSSSNNGVTLYANAVVQSNYQNTTSLAFFGTLKDAFNAVNSNETIKVLENTTETVASTLASGKTGVKLDLNGKTISYTNNNITNNGSLEIYSSNGNGVIETTKAHLIYNNGTLTTNVTNTSNNITFRSSTALGATRLFDNGDGATLTLRSNVTLEFTRTLTGNNTDYRYAIYTSGLVNINGATINNHNNTNKYDRGIRISTANARVVMTSGTITTSGIAIHNSYGTGTTTPVLQMSGGSITSTQSHGIQNNNSGNFLITGGTVTGYNRGIYVSAGSLTLGTKDSTVSTTSPEIISTETSTQYGVYLEPDSGAIFNFYDGVIRSYAGSGKSIYGAIADKPTGYVVKKVVENGIESAYLEIPTFTATFYYNSGSSIASATEQCTASNGVSCTVTLPSAVSSSTGRYGETYVNIASSTSSMSAASSLTITGDTNFYAYYSKSLTNYYYNSTNGYTTRTLYRNEFFESNSSFVARLSTTNTGTTNYTPETGPGSSAWIGFSTARDTTTEYSTVQAAANSNRSTLYSVYEFTTQFQAGAHVASVSPSSKTCKVTTSSLYCTISGMTATPEDDYVFIGWTKSGTSTIYDPYNSLRIENNNEIYIATAVPGYYQNTTTGDYYMTLSDAFSLVASNQTIKLLVGTTEEETATLPSTKTGIKLDLNNKYLDTDDNFTIINNGNLEITNGPDIESYYGYRTYLFENNGTLNLNNMGLNSGVSRCVLNNGTLRLSGSSSSIVSDDDYAVENTGTIIINGGSISGTSGAIHGYGSISITDGNITGSTTLTSASDLTITNSTLYGDIYALNSTINITNSNLYLTAGDDDVIGVYNVGGTLNVSNSTINVSGEISTDLENPIGIRNSGIATVSNVNIFTAPNDSSNIFSQTYSYGIQNSGTLTLIGGSIDARELDNQSTVYGIYSSAGTLTIGVNDSTVSTTSPTIESDQYGVYIAGGTFNFYDGVIMSQSGTGYALNQDPNNTPDGYEVLRRLDDAVESAYLDRANYVATFRYWNGNAIASTTEQCTVTSGTTCTVTVPTAVSNSTGQYGGTYVNVSRSVSSLSAGSLTLYNDTNFYAYYRSNVTNYYYNGTSYTNRTLYRNEFFTNTSTLVAKLSTSNTGTSNYSTETGPGNSTWAGLSTAQDTTAEYSSVQEAADSNSTTLYTVYRFDATFAAGTNISSVSPTSKSCNVTTGSTSCIVTAPTVIPASGYFANNWTESDTGSTFAIEDPITLLQNNRTYTATAIQASYKNTSTNTYYLTLNDAFNGVSNNQTIQVGRDVTETSNATLGVGKTNIILDLNGHTITMSHGATSGSTITNNGTLKITNTATGNAIITTDHYSAPLTNKGVLTIEGDASTKTIEIDNNDTLTIYNDVDATLNLNDYSSVIMYNGSPDDDTAIYNFGTLNISGGTIDAESAIGTGVYSNSEINMDSGYVVGENAFWLIDGTLNISGGEVVGSYHAIYSYSNDIEMNITGGTITSYLNNTIGLKGGTLTIGEDDSAVSTTVPLIHYLGDFGYYGIYYGDGSRTFNFFDGIIKSNGGTGYAYNEEPDNMPPGYRVIKETTAGVESAYLEQIRYTATFYYWNGSQIATTTSECTVTSGDSCTVSIPSVVSNSTGQYGTAYKDVVAVTNHMGSTSLDINNNYTFYANYSSPITIYYPNTSNGVSNTNSVLYRNEYFTSDSAMTVKTATTRTGTTQATSVTLSSLKGTLLGLNSSVNAYTEYYSISGTTVVNNSNTTYYAITKFSENALFHYNSNTTSGSFTDSLATQSVNSRYYCTSTSAMGTWHATTSTVPSSVTSSVGKYNSPYGGISISSNEILTASTYAGGSTYYAYYSQPLTVYYPNTSDGVSVSNNTFSRDEYYSSASAMSAHIAYAQDNPIEYKGSRLSGFNASADTTSFASLTDNSITNSDVITYYAITLQTMNATIHYNSNTTVGEFTDATTTVETGTRYYCVDTSTMGVEHLSVTLPQAVRNSVGKYNSTYEGVSSSSSDIVPSLVMEDNTYYAYYTRGFTIYYPNTSNAIGVKNALLFRNEYYNSPTTMNVVTSNQEASTTQATSIDISQLTSLKGTFVGFTDTINTYGRTVNVNDSSVINTESRLLYAITTGSENVTFKYNSNTTSGSFTNATQTVATTATYYVWTISQMGTNHEYISEVPSVVTSSVGKYNSPYQGVSSTTGSITNATSYRGGITYYAYYSSPVTIWYPDSISTRTSDTYNRNEYYTSTTAMGAAIATTNSSATNITFTSSVSDYDFYGFATTAGTNTRTYSTVSGAASSATATLYAILRRSRTATIYYNSGSGNGVVNIATASTNTVYQYLRCSSTAANISNNNYTIPTVVTESVGPYGNEYNGVSGDTNSMIIMFGSEATTLYATYTSPVTNYYYDGNSYTNRNLYRNSVFTSTSEITNYLSDVMGVGNYIPENGPGDSAWAGLSRGQYTSAEYNTIQAAANSIDDVLYTVYEFTAYFEEGSHISSISQDTVSCRVMTADTNCTVIPPVVTPESGYVAISWIDDLTGSMFAISDPIVLTENEITYTANAGEPNYTNTTTNNQYSTLSEALYFVQSGETIITNNDVVETEEATLASGKTGVKLNLNGYTITSSATTAITNNGELDIYSSVYGGILESTGTTTINNNGTLTTSEADGSNLLSIMNTTNNSDAVLLYTAEGATSTLKENTTLRYTVAKNSDVTYRYIINTLGVTTVDGATLDNTISGTSEQYDRGVRIGHNNARFVMNDGSLSSPGHAIVNSWGLGTTTPAVNIAGGTITSNNSATIYNVADGAIRISDGTITNTGIYAILQSSSGLVEVLGGTITGKTYGINVTGGTLNVNGGTITGQTSHGIYSNGSGTVNIGDDDGTISTTTPVIQTTGSSSLYGIKVDNSGVLNWYDGLLKSSSGTGYALNVTPTSIPTGATVTKSTSSGVETAFLKRQLTARIYYNNTTSSGTLNIASTTAKCYNAANTEGCSISIPTGVSNSVGRYGATYKGVARNTNKMATVGKTSATIYGDCTLYAAYSKAITNYYYDGSSSTSRSIYRNEFFTSTSAMTAVLAAANNVATNYEQETGPGNSTWGGLSTDEDEEPEYATQTGAAKTTKTSLYTVYTFTGNFVPGEHVTSVSPSTVSCNIKYNGSTCKLTAPTVTPESGYYATYWRRSSNNGLVDILGPVSIGTNNLTYTALTGVRASLSFPSMSSGEAQWATKNSDPLDVPSGFGSPSRITVYFNKAKITPTDNPNLVLSVQYKVSGDSSWHYLTLNGDSESPATYWWGTTYGSSSNISGCYMGSRTSFTGTLTAKQSELPTDITQFRIKLLSNANAYGNATVSMTGATIYLYADE